MSNFPSIALLGSSRTLLVSAIAWLLVAACSTTGPTPSNTTSNSNSTASSRSVSSPSQLAAFSTLLSGLNQLPPVPRSLSNARGRMDAVLDKQTLLLRWKLSFQGLTGDAIAGHFHGPAAANAHATVAVPIRGPVSSPMEGQVFLNPAQASDLVAGKWYLDIHTLAFPGGEIRGQMTLRE